MRLYRALLHLYPASFRREYGSELIADFSRRAGAASGMAKAGLWLAVTGDVIGNAVRLHLDLIRQDVGYAVRTLSRTPGFALTAILVTALGIGANTAAFSVTNFVFLRPLPYANPDRLVTVWERTPDYGQLEMSPPNYRDTRSMTTSFEAMGAYHGLEANVVAASEPARLSGVAVTADLLPVLGVQPAIGRLFTRDEEEHDAGARILLSHGLWERSFGSSPGVIGQTVLLDGTPHVVLGVMPPTFSFPTREVAFWTLMPPGERLNEERDNYWFYVLARLKPGVTLEQARADVSMAASRLERSYPDVNKKIGGSAFFLREEYSERSRAMLMALCGASLSVLLIACANLANLLIARSFSRRRELELRAALGAGRERLVRQLVTESLLIALAGGICGVLVAVAAVPVLARLIPATLPIPATPSVDLQALAVAGVLTLLTGVGFGVIPALRSSATGSFEALREGVRGGGLRGLRMRSALVVIEVAASVVLLVWAGLLMRSLNQIGATDPGFRIENVLTARTALPRPKYTLAVRRHQYYTQVLEQLRAIPGVSHAGFVSFLPMTMGGGIFPVAMPGEKAEMQSGRVASMRYATPDYLAAMGIPLRRGRDLRESDDMTQPMVAVVSQSFVDRHLPGTDPIGKHFTFAYQERTIVGVVGDVRVRGLERVAEPQVYLPYQQVDDESFPFFTPKDVAIRATLPSDALIPALRRIVHDADSEQPVSNVSSMDAIVTRQTASRTVQVRVLIAFAVVALVLAAVGIHGLLAFSVSQRRHEIGVRMALGAEPGRIARGIVRHSALLGVAGVIPGVAIGYAGARAMESLLFGVTPGDVTTFAIAAVLCALTTIVGSLLPAVRAVSVPPALAFRAD